MEEMRVLEKMVFCSNRKLRTGALLDQIGFGRKAQ